MKLILCFILAISNVFAATTTEATASNKVDNIKIHSFDNSDKVSRTLLEKIQLYDNKDLSGTPKYIIDNFMIIDLSNGTKEYNYKDYYKYIKREPRDEADEGPLYSIKEMPFSFVKFLRGGFVLPIESKINELAKIAEHNLFFKLTPNIVNFQLASVIWQNDQTLSPVHKLLKEDSDFADFMKKLAGCVKIKSPECLINLDEGFKPWINEWTIINDTKLCKLYRKNSGLINYEDLKNKYIVDWDQLDKFLKLDSSAVKSDYYVSRFGEFYSYAISIEGKEACNKKLDLIVEVGKRKGEKISISIR